MTDTKTPHYIVFKYSFFKLDADVAVVGPFASEAEASTALTGVDAECLCGYEACLLPAASLESVLATLRRHKAEVDAGVAAELACRGGQLTIDQVISRCEGLPDLPVVIASKTQYDGMSPSRVGSYRGGYDQLMIMPVNSTTGVNLFVFKEQMKRSIGSCYGGYKGGEYYMSGDTHVWVSEYGVSSGLAVVDVRLSEDALAVLLICDQK